MIHRALTLLTTLCLLATAGCGGGSEAATASRGGSNASKGLPNSLTFSSTAVPGDGFELTYVEAVLHNMMSDGQQYPAIILQLANYDRGDSSYHPEPSEEGQRRVTLNFSAPVSKKLAVGTYDVDGTMAQDFYLSTGIEGKGIDTGLYNGQGSGEIVAVDDHTISGRVSVKDSSGTTIEATFTTAYTKSLY